MEEQRFTYKVYLDNPLFVEALSVAFITINNDFFRFYH